MDNKVPLNSRNIKDCVSELQLAHQHVIENWDKLYPNLPNPTLVQTYRDNKIQAVFYMQGRFDLVKVNEARKNIGLLPISQKENRIITKLQTGSKHGVYPSEAVDYLFIEGKRILTAKESESLYKKLAALIVEKVPTIRWGGDWNGNGLSSDEKFLDMPHFEVK